ncbi:pilus assembly protein CpaE [Pseudactinotalea sp. Z1748]|uniref:pilus assembly protein CpaE n=1 Tax=Pseudactinotalea sp. Z1748 TaxID=3413027 RepID=UPI003C7DFECC
MSRSQQELISDSLAQQLQDAGLVWHPEAGDHFRIRAQALTEDVFILSHMVIEAREFDTGTVLRFNGTTEWALDSVAKEDALWLPREDQLRDRLGGAFVRLERVGDDYELTTRSHDGAQSTYTGRTPAEAYGQGLLDLVRHAVEPA